MAVSIRKSDFVTKKKTRRKTTAANAKKAPHNTKSSPNKKKKSLKQRLVSELKKLNLMKQETIDALPHTKKHETHTLKVVNSFITVLSSDAQNI